MKGIEKRAYGVLILITSLWGISFPVMDSCLERIGPFTFVSIRYFCGALALTALLHKDRKIEKKEMKSGILIGIPFAAAAVLQMVGLERTSVANASFITGLTVVFVPVIAFLFDGFVPSRKNRWGIAISLLGVALMSKIWESSVNTGDLWVMASSIAFSIQIYHLEKYGKGKEPIKLTCIVLWTVMVLTAPAAVLLEDSFRISWDAGFLLAVLFVGIFCTAGAIYLQNRYQPLLPASQAAVIYLLEPVTATAFSHLLGEKTALHQIAGGAVILAGAWVVIRKENKKEVCREKTERRIRNDAF